MSPKKLQALSYDIFHTKQAALPRFKRLCRRTIRATKDGQHLAPRLSKHDFYYRLFEEFVFLLDLQNDLLLEINEFKPVKNRPPTPLPRPNLREILRNVDLTLSNSSSQRATPPPASPSGYSSSSSSSSESTTTTTPTTTTTVRHVWSDSDDSSDGSRQSKRVY